MWLHLARTGGDDPAAARALIQQVIRMASRLRTVCPGRWPLGRARAARAAALQTIRDGLLSAETLAGLLPDDGVRLQPGALLALVDRAALQRTAPAALLRTAAGAPECTDAGAPVRTEPAAPPPHQSGDGVGAPGAHRRRTGGRTAPARRAAVRPPGDAPPRRRHPQGHPADTARRLGAPGTRAGTSGQTPHAARPLQIVTESKIRHPQSDDKDDKDDNVSSSTSGSAP